MKTRRNPRLNLVLTLLVAGSTALVGACEQLDKDSDAIPAVDIWATYLTCSSADTFTNQVNDILVGRCYACHETESTFLLQRSNVGYNFGSSLKQLLANDFFNPHINPLLIKAKGGDSHVGGQIFTEIDDEYASIVEWIYEERETPCEVGGGAGEE